VATANQQGSAAGPTKKKKTPRRVIYCSDGVVEEYSTDEEEEKAKEEAERKRNAWRHINPATLGWMAWTVHHVWLGGERVVAACDFLGERIAWWLGITSPKYYYELQEAKRIEEREAARAAKEDAEMKGWRASAEGQGDTGSVVMAAPPTANKEPNDLQLQPQTLRVPDDDNE
jgi:hypothetical protein